MQTVTKHAFTEQDRPVLKATVKGIAGYPRVEGAVHIYALPNGIYLQGDFTGLPKSSDFAFHVHEGLACGELGDKLLPLPDIMSDAEGKASTQLYLARVMSTIIAGKPIVLHLKADGKETQVACGLLARVL